MQNDITLRPFEDGDMALFKKWLHAEHVARWYEHPEAWLAEAEGRHGKYSWIAHFIVLCADAPVGFCQYYEYDRGGETWQGDIDAKGAYSIDYLIGEPAYIGKGLSPRLIAALLEKIRRHEHARCVIVQPEAQNAASCGALRSAGFAWDAQNKLYKMLL